MRIIKKLKNSILVIVCVSLLMVNNTTTFASSEPQEPDKAVIFLFDTSGSMETNDPHKLALDSAIQFIYSLPTDFKVGVVAYSNDVVLQTELVSNDSRSNLVNDINTIEYSGYSNATAGLESALAMLKDVPNSHIVMLSDGEILLHSDTATSTAKEAFVEQIDAASENGTEVHFIALADETLIDSAIAEISEKTDGSFHYAVGANDIQTAIDDILKEELGVKKTSLGITNTEEGLSDIEIDLQNGTSTSRILVTSTTDIIDIVADFEAESVTQDKGLRYAFIELKNPMINSVDLHIETRDKGEISIDVVSELDVKFGVSIDYTDTIPTDTEATNYNRTANITLAFENHQGKPILKEEMFEDIPIVVDINGQSIIAPIKNGALNFDFEVKESQTLDIQADLSSIPFHILNQENISLDLEEPPMIEKNEINYIPYIMGGLAFIVLVVVLVRPKKKKAKVSKPVKEVLEEPVSKYSYTGRMDIYITRTKRDFDFPPLTFNLFHISNSRKISLDEILKRLDVDEIFEGADKIHFRPSANRKLIITNDSDCTVMKNREIILKGKSIELFADSKLDISLEDEVSELVLQYKDVKEPMYS